MASASPCALVIFGASGDLAKRKLIPAIYEIGPREIIAGQVCAGRVFALTHER